LGKSTLVNTLFNAPLYPAKEHVPLSEESVKTVAVQVLSTDIEENGVRLKLNVVDTPGFGDFINNEDRYAWSQIIRFKIFMRIQKSKESCLMICKNIPNLYSWKPILETIESRFDAYLEQENRVNRSKITDTRVNACLYFIAPTGHSLKALDIEFMKRLHKKVNLIPVIAKSDTMTNEEITAFKERVRFVTFVMLKLRSSWHAMSVGKCSN
jgi:septin 7